MPPFFRHPASLEHDTGHGHPERADRIRAIEAELEARDWLGWDQVEAPRAAEEQLLRIHPREYVEQVREYSERGVPFDMDTPTSPGTYEAALRAAGGACALADSLLSGGERTGFSCLRPPGHHAETARAMGFCLFANAAIAARHALDALGADRVLVVDWDVHHGNGTNALFHDSPEVLFVSIHQFPFWPGTGPLTDVGEGAGEGYSINLPVPPGSDEDQWLALVEHVVVPAARAFEPELVLVSAGFDAHRRDPLASCMLETSSFAELARHVAALAGSVNAPIGVMLEGGYDLQALSSSVVATLEALSADGSAQPPRSVERTPLVDAAVSVLGPYWAL